MISSWIEYPPAAPLGSPPAGVYWWPYWMATIASRLHVLRGGSHLRCTYVFQSISYQHLLHCCTSGHIALQMTHRLAAALHSKVRRTTYTLERVASTHSMAVCSSSASAAAPPLRGCTGGHIGWPQSPRDCTSSVLLRTYEVRTSFRVLRDGNHRLLFPVS